jgi:hypothetical protein
MISACRKDFRLAFDRPHASPQGHFPLCRSKAWSLLNLVFSVKQNVMPEQANYKCLKFAALRRPPPAGSPPFLTPDGAACHSP